MADTKGYHFRLPDEVIAQLDELVDAARASASPEVAAGINRTTLIRVAIREMHERLRASGTAPKKNPKRKGETG